MEALNIIKCSSKVNTTFSPKRSIIYLAIHYTAGVTSRPGTARNVATWFSKPEAKASADFVVDDNEIIQYNPDIRNYFCWAVGGRKYPRTNGGAFYGQAKSSNTINIEICSSNKAGKITNPNDENYYFTEKVINNAERLIKYLMKEYNITIDRVIRHYDVNGKPCPGVYGWNDGWQGSKANSKDWINFKERLLQSPKDNKSVVKLSYNGEKHELKGMLIEGSNYVRIRELVEKVFRKKVDWNPKTQEVIITDVKDNLNGVK